MNISVTLFDIHQTFDPQKFFRKAAKELGKNLAFGAGALGVFVGSIPAAATKAIFIGADTLGQKIAKDRGELVIGIAARVLFGPTYLAGYLLAKYSADLMEFGGLSRYHKERIYGFIQ